MVEKTDPLTCVGQKYERGMLPYGGAVDCRGQNCIRRKRRGAPAQAAVSAYSAQKTSISRSVAQKEVRKRRMTLISRSTSRSPLWNLIWRHFFGISVDLARPESVPQGSGAGWGGISKHISSGWDDVYHTRHPKITWGWPEACKARSLPPGNTKHPLLPGKRL